MNLTLEKYSFLRNNKYYKFIRDIIIPFAFKVISKLFSKNVDEKLIVMGAYTGNSYLGNTKHLFEFLNKNSKYKLVWITKSNSLLKRLTERGLNAVKMFKLSTIKLLKQARYIFSTHGIFDFLPIEFSPGTTFVLTWHGTPIKKIVADYDKLFMYGKWGDIFRLKLRHNQYVNFILTPTAEKEEHMIIKNAFKIPEEKILDLGYPRNDILFKNKGEFIQKLKIKFNIPNSIKKIILYAPTFREDLHFRFPLSQLELETLDSFLKGSNSYFLLKAHIFETQLNFKDFENIVLVNKASDIQELLLISDVLVTDYSSAIFDYLLTLKPILLFTYDLDEYLKSRGMYYEFKKIAPGPVLLSGRDLIKAIKNIDEIDKKYENVRKELRDRFNKYKDGKSIERILNFFNIKYNLQEKSN